MADLGVGDARPDSGARQMSVEALPRTIVLERDDRTASARLPLRSIAAWLAGWTAFVVVMAGVVSIQKGVPFAYAFRSEAINYYTLAAASLVVWAASARLTALAWPAGAQIAAHALIGALLITLWQGVYGGYMWSVMGASVWARLYRGTWMFQLMNAAVLYAAVLGGTLALQSARRARTHEAQQHALALAAREAELRALTAQLEPHFLLNTLNSVLALVDDSPPAARLMIERLSELLKASFDEIEEPHVPLGRELDLLSAYLGIEQVRFGDRLAVRIDASAAARAVPVPPLLLQPLVENAVKHGVAPRPGPARVAIAAAVEDGRLIVRVIDSGPGFDDAGERNGRGLPLVERRLRAFAPGGELRVERGADGFAVIVTLPA
jgi:two-component system, LytTR family, sensor kinase